VSNDRPAITITQLTRYLKRVVEGNRHLQDVWLRGEISNFKKHSRGHMYLTLKDANSRISAVMFSADNQSLLFTPEDGMTVLVRGQVSVYEPYGQYQLYIKEMQQDGVGNLFLAFEQLKKKLEAEGLFDPRIKKPLPAFPQTIGIVTSPTGAAIRDMFTTVKRRYPAARLIVFPVLVQGEQAAPSIAKAIELANRTGHVEVLIVGRGGGSIEDLWAFNEEQVARAIFHSTLPIVSAVGHETDFTIADFVADLRAATPTAAAELVVPNLMDIEERLMDRLHRLKIAMTKKLDRQKDRLASLDKTYAFRFPSQLVRQKELDLDRLMERLVTRSRQHVHQAGTNLNQMERLLYKHHPDAELKRAGKELFQLQDRLTRAMGLTKETNQQRFRHILSQLNAYSPLNVMERGYSLTYKEGNLVKSIHEVENGESIQVKLKDGELNVKVVDKKERESNVTTGS
jgi:exodeoxyribonuclease VII large subunit